MSQQSNHPVVTTAQRLHVLREQLSWFEDQWENCQFDNMQDLWVALKSQIAEIEGTVTTV